MDQKYGIKLNTNPTHPVFLDSNLLQKSETSEKLLSEVSADVPVSSHFNADAQVGSSSLEDLDFSNGVLKYVNRILMEEDVEDKAGMLLESAALQAAEKSLYELIGEQYPAPIDCQHAPNCETPVEKSFGAINGHCDVSDSEAFCCELDSDLYLNRYDRYHDTVSAVVHPLPRSYSSSSNSIGTIVDEPLLNMQKEAFANLQDFVDASRGKKNPYPRSTGVQVQRSNKQSAIHTESSLRGEMFDTVLLCNQGKIESALRKAFSEVTKLNDGGTRRGKPKGGGRRNVVDMYTLLTDCAQAVANDDHKAANEFLKQIRQHASPTGDGMQRLAHYFACGLQARLTGSETKTYSSFVHWPISAAEILKAYHIYYAACPFSNITTFFSNETIMNVAENATELHVIDFGILYGFQWPTFLQYISRRPGGPPKLRLTGIDVPCPGFRPSERIEETGRRLASYAETFKVPFEFNAIVQKWETIKLEDIKINKDEMVVVNCRCRLGNLLDETVTRTSPRNIVLNLIREINPSVFVVAILNGAYNAPFFTTRFREALFHYSAFFDMIDANIPREIHERTLLERTLLGCEAMSVIACEGAERIERPETYKQWQARITRASFELLPLDQEIKKRARNSVELSYHKDFVIDEDSQWLLQGWKGRIVYALSSWRPR